MRGGNPSQRREHICTETLSPGSILLSDILVRVRAPHGEATVFVPVLNVSEFFSIKCFGIMREGVYWGRVTEAEVRALHLVHADSHQGAAEDVLVRVRRLVA